MLIIIGLAHAMVTGRLTWLVLLEFASGFILYNSFKARVVFDELLIMSGLVHKKIQYLFLNAGAIGL